MLEQITKINDAVNNCVWGWPAIILLGFVGVLMTCLTKFFQVCHIGHWFKKTIGAIFGDKHVTKHTSDKSISQFQSLCTALAATVGTGNITGVASAIAIGGPGAVFWMWVIAFFGMMTNYAENVLGILFRVKNDKGEWSGGAMYYLKNGLGAKKGCKRVGVFLSVLFSCFCLLASFGIGNIKQINAISTNIQSAFFPQFANSNILIGSFAMNIPKAIVGIGLVILAGLVVVGGLKRIASVTEKIVPTMVILYFVGSLIVCIVNGSKFGEVFGSIFRCAFSVKAAAGGGIGAGIAQAVKMGMKRGVFSNEAGLGSSVMVHSNSNVKEPVQQGMWGIFEVFADTIVVCSITAFVILSSGYVNLATGEVPQSIIDNSDPLVGHAFAQIFGQPGEWFIAVALLLFAFSTVLGWSHYGTKAFEYLFGTKITIVYKIIFVGIIFVGAVIGANLAWELSDTFNGLMMLPNLIGVLVLSPLVYKCTKNYVDRHFHNKKEEPMISMYDDIQKEQAEALKNEAKK